MTFDYFTFSREKVFLSLNRDRVLDAHGKVELVTDNEKLHPHAIIESRPTWGAQQYVLSKNRALMDARKAAVESIDREEIEAEVAAMDEATFKAHVAEVAQYGLDIELGNKAALAQAIASSQLLAQPAVTDAAREVMLTRVAVMVAGFGGDWSLYAKDLGLEPKAVPNWPKLTEEPATLRQRCTTIWDLLDRDIVRLDQACRAASQMTSKQVGNSEGAPTSSTTGTAPA